MTKGLMDDNQQPYVKQELERSFPIIRRIRESSGISRSVIYNDFAKSLLFWVISVWRENYKFSTDYETILERYICQRSHV